ncbi:hypothetical protein [Nocardia sp. CNY236]|uniref:hypothetical protein n=1 Tax=Nocardia sp. CNY236 TaxID=1169152 RepID=UPI00040A2B33|nr:hypothetical protein [Nocardia sp. CNY236]
MTERHVVVYCEVCGDVFADSAGESICFDSVTQAITYLATRAAGGWLYDHTRVVCDGCRAVAWCATHGHTFSEADMSGRAAWWPLGRTIRPRTCGVCGIAETEIEDLS